MKKVLSVSVIGCFMFLWCLGCETGEYLESDVCEADDTSCLDDGDAEDLADRAISVGLYQAEKFTAQSGCKIATNNAGYTGTGFVDYGGNGTWIELNNVNVAAAGSYTLKFRYATGSGSRQCAIIINGANVGNVAFSSTGSWTKWGTASLTKSLKAGKNTVRILANTSSGGPNLDSLELLSTTADNCPNDPNKTEPGLCGCGKPEGTCGGSGQQLTLNPVADAYVDSSASGQNRGTAAQLLVDSSPAVYQTFLRFSVPTLTASVSRATLRLYVTNPTGDGPDVYLTSNSWTETGVNYSNRPASQGSIIADVGSVAAGWLEIDVTKAISAKGDYAFLLLPDSTDGADFDSREGSNKPQLVVITGDGGGGPIDNCPNDPNKTEPGLCGCGKPEGTCSGTGAWKFVVVGDSRGSNNGVNTSVLSHLVNAIIAEKAEFVLFPGDLTTNGTQTQFNTWINTVKPLYNANVGVYAIRGNHDDASLSAWNNAFSGNYRFPQNGPVNEKNLTYSVVHKNVFFVGLDNYSGSAEVNQSWLNTQLAANTQPHVFVFGHEPAFAADHSDTLDDHSSARNAFWQSIKNAGGRAYFCGHDHFYDHARIGDGGSSSDDLHQFIVGTAGAPLYSFNGSYQGSNGGYTPTQQHFDDQYGYVVILVDGRNIELTFKKRSGNSYVEADWLDYTVP